MYKTVKTSYDNNTTVVLGFFVDKSIDKSLPFL